MIQIWFLTLMVILIWYIIVTFLVAVKGLSSLHEMLQKISAENQEQEEN